MYLRGNQGPGLAGGENYMGQYLGDASSVISAINAGVNQGVATLNTVENDLYAAGATNTLQQAGITSNTLYIVGGLILLYLLMRK